MLGEPVTSSPSVSVRRLAAAALAAGALVGAAALPATAADHAARPSVEISRVQADSPGPDDRSARSLNNEWVEITNHDRRSVNLDGWKLSSKDGKTYTFRHYRLDGHATVRVHTGKGRDTAHDVYQDRRDYAWDNRSDTATLRNDHRRLVDDKSWGGHRGGGHGGGGHNGGGGHEGGGHGGGGHR
ncbi:lamin tail domain-containing protein [Streptomyces prunicolor]|uniref:lamin tail domain-containing protein n=1 Tax=Streptomyces prunicolor TaxID=67348 RepID=UPI002250803D|nr:lamin tail domain-containing protein [Streptomyces prunicolor]MCX5237559.1 lamin tail domain-containing protein [Streptomyces prunicolor]